jgi:hypothetical protein
MIAEFKDERTGRSPEEKIEVDLSAALNDIFANSLDPTCVRFSRANEDDILLHRTAEGVNILQLALR